ncbi:MAG: hypothetical protein ACK5NA_11435 [Enterococcus sp.]
MTKKEKKKLILSVIDATITRSGKKVKIKTKHRKDKRKFTSYRDARRYEKAMRTEYFTLLSDELDRLLASKND